jgi:hypothetical protein
MKYEVLDPSTAGKIFHNPIKLANKPEGQPYINTAFQWAKIERVKQKALMRFNVFADEFEFISPKGDTLILDKLADFNPIEFPDAGSKFVLCTYTTRNGKNHTGYLKESYTEGKYTLYTQDNITFYEGKEAKTTLESARPAKYAKGEARYFLKKENAGVFEFPTSKKQLLGLFPSQKEAIDLYFKKETIDFKLQADRIKLLVFLNSL